MSRETFIPSAVSAVNSAATPYAAGVANISSMTFSDKITSKKLLLYTFHFVFSVENQPTENLLDTILISDTLGITPDFEVKAFLKH